MRTVPERTEPCGGSDRVLGCLVAYNEFGGYCISTGFMHRQAAQCILAGDVWERATVEYIVARVGDGDVIHAGTFFGDFLPALSNACGPDAMVWAFEPNPESHRCAAITVRINDLANVTLTEAALGSSEGTAPMLVRGKQGRNLGGGSRIVSDPPDPAAGQTIRVRTVAIDDVVPADRHVSVIQLDVEGSERPALAGALATVRRCRPLLVLESVPDDAWFAKSILGLGYTVAATIDENTILEPGQG
ncbi:MAG: FkbM family methyltransferase [Planctomycetota bacterium]|jgi:FkbM family methyltransferase